MVATTPAPPTPPPTLVRIQPIASDGSITTTSTLTPPPIVERIIERTPVNQYITNEYVTNPTTIIQEVIEREIVRESSRSSNNGVDRTLFDKQVDQIFESMGDNNQSLRESFTTDLLTVSGNTSLATLNVSGTSTLASLTATDISATTLTSDTLTTDSIFLPAGTPASTASRLYNTAGDLYWNGSLIAGGAVGSWNTNGSGDVYRLTGNVGVGTSTPEAGLHVAGDGRVRFEQNGVRKYDWNVDTVGNFNLEDATAVANRLLVTPAGNVGIGTISPTSKLTISGTAGQSAFNVASSTGASMLTVAANGNVGIGTSSPTRAFHVYHESNSGLGLFESGGSAAAVLLYSGNTTTNRPYAGAQGNNFVIGHESGGVRLSVLESGNIGIGTTTPSAQLTIAGTVRFAALGAGSLATDALGNVTVSSDERLKDIEGEYVAGLQAILGLEPIEYRWNAESGYDQAALYAGFSAQNVQDFLPEAVGENANGMLSLSDRPILAAVVNAVQELWDMVTGNQADIADLQTENERLKERLEAVEAELNIDAPEPTESSPEPEPEPEEITEPEDVDPTPTEEESDEEVDTTTEAGAVVEETEEVTDPVEPAETSADESVVESAESEAASGDTSEPDSDSVDAPVLD